MLTAGKMGVREQDADRHQSPDFVGMVRQVHDELVLQVAPGEREDVEALVRREMGAAIDLGDVPLDVSVGVGRS